jgi:hypothetical protein
MNGGVAMHPPAQQEFLGWLVAELDRDVPIGAAGLDVRLEIGFNPGPLEARLLKTNTVGLPNAIMQHSRARAEKRRVDDPGVGSESDRQNIVDKKEARLRRLSRHRQMRHRCRAGTDQKMAGD